MENKKILNRIIMLLSALIIITFAVFYKQVSDINISAKWFRVLYFGILYASIICSGVGLIVCFMNAFKDQFDLIWFVQFLNLCALVLIMGLTLLFAIFEDVSINVVYLIIVCEYLLVNVIGTIIFICTNFKYFKKDFASIFKSGEPDKSYRYGLEEEPSKTKAEKYALPLEDTSNEKEDDLPADTTNESNLENADENNSSEDEIKEEVVDAKSYSESNEENIETENSENEEEQEITKEEAQELSDTITDIEGNSSNETQLAEIENSLEVQRLIKENEQSSEDQPSEDEVKVYDEDEIKIAKGSKKLNKISDDELVVTMEDTSLAEQTSEEDDEDDDLEDKLPLDEDSTIPENEKYSEISEATDLKENEENPEEEVDYDKQISREILENRKEEKISKLSKLIKNK